jgi:DNA repair photolyase
MSTNTQAELPLPKPKNTHMARSILVRSRIPGMDYTINPYTGCVYGCSYCYATFMCRYVGRKTEDWGSFLYPKTNLESVLRKELGRLSNRTASIFVSSVTDPYQPPEKRFCLTRKALELLVEFRHRGLVQVLTKSPLVTRDIDLFRQLNTDVGLTITASDDHIGRFLEGTAPPPARRLAALGGLNAAGLKTYVFVGPLFPHFLAVPESLEELFASIAQAGTTEVYVAHFNLRPAIAKRVVELGGNDDRIMRYYSKKRPNAKRLLDALVRPMLERYRLKLRAGAIIDH